ncbi:hypothetical protein [Deinococcus sp.]|uniref:TubC N-terminal docking domain-related protein n=1 Tax=Deinococcus sp. TaxID=47478 RepID=UPI0025FD02E2|nr:hypothetical protein [Deinococcus sp.]
MVALELLTVLEARGVKLSIQAGQLTSRGPVGAITPDLGEQIKAQKAALLEVLSLPLTGDMLPPLPWEDVPGPLRLTAPLPSPDPLPEHLAVMVDTAKTGTLSRGTITLASGLVPDLGVYVLAWAECWPGDRVHILRRLEEAYAVTAQGRQAR